MAEDYRGSVTGAGGTRYFEPDGVFFYRVPQGVNRHDDGCDQPAADYWRSQMAALVQALSRFGSADVEAETLKLLAIFCGVGLLVSVLFATYGLDLSPGFF
jgi:hypothetical protein